MPIGAGLAPAGTSLAGFGVVDAASAPNAVPLPDPFTGQSLTGRFINQATHDYEFGPDGRLLGMPTVPQLVVLAIWNNIDLSTLQQKGPNFAAFLRALVQEALADLIRRKLVLLTGVTVLEPNPDAAVAVAYWTDLTTGLPQQTPF